MKANWTLRAGLAAVVVFGFVALAGPWLAPDPGIYTVLSGQFGLPSHRHWFGQNQNGQDILSLLILGARTSFLIGMVTVLLAGGIGIALGLIAGYRGGYWDATIARLMEMILAFPGILLAIAITAVMGPSVLNVVVAMVAGGWVAFARLARGQTLALREREFVRAARLLGASTPRILALHILPNMAAPLIVQSTFSMATAILTEASLTFLGIGAPIGTPSWGASLNEGARYLLQAPHMAVYPGLVMVIFVASFYLLGEGIQKHVEARG